MRATIAEQDGYPCQRSPDGSARRLFDGYDGRPDVLGSRRVPDGHFEFGTIYRNARTISDDNRAVRANIHLRVGVAHRWTLAASLRPAKDDHRLGDRGLGSFADHCRNCSHSYSIEQFSTLVRI